MWKKLFLFVGIALLLVVVGYQISFFQTKKGQLQSDGALEAEIGTQELDVIPTGNGSDKITKNTKIIIESYNANGQLIERKEEYAGVGLLGNNRLDMLIYANTYQEHAPAEEMKEGLERMVLESYSSDSVTLVKYYGEPTKEQGYFIGLKDNAVIVYLEDRSEVYEYTNIEMWSLPQEIQSQLVEGIYVKNEQELFDFLQTYSS